MPHHHSSDDALEQKITSPCGTRPYSATWAIYLSIGRIALLSVDNLYTPNGSIFFDATLWDSRCDHRRMCR